MCRSLRFIINAVLWIFKHAMNDDDAECKLHETKQKTTTINHTISMQKRTQKSTQIHILLTRSLTHVGPKQDNNNKKCKQNTRKKNKLNFITLNETDASNTKVECSIGIWFGVFSKMFILF